MKRAKPSPLAVKPSPPGVSEFNVRAATKSYSSLEEVLGQLNLAEINAALVLEASTRRRRSIINRLVSRGAALAAADYVNAILKEIQWPGKRAS